MKEIEEPSLFDIDPENLDQEWIAHSGNYYQTAVKVANARTELERSKAAKEVADDDLKKIEAELYLMVLKSPDDFGLEKATVDAVKAAVLIDHRRDKRLRKTYECQEETNKCKHLVDLLEAEMWALTHKKTALEKMVELRLANYYSEPRARDGDYRREMDEKKSKRALDRRK